MIITFAAALVLLDQWMSQEERTARRRDRKPSAREERRLQMWEAAWGAKGPPVSSTPREVQSGHERPT